MAAALRQSGVRQIRESWSGGLGGHMAAIRMTAMRRRTHAAPRMRVSLRLPPSRPKPSGDSSGGGGGIMRFLTGVHRGVSV